MKNSRRNRRIIGVTASLLFLFVVSLTGGLHAASAVEILSRVDQVMNAPKDRKVTMKMVLVDKNGNEKVRIAESYQKGDDHRLIKFLEPADQKGVGFLSLPNDVMYVYFPAFKKVRRIASHVKNSNFAGTDFTYDDLSTFKYSEDYNPELLEETDSFYVLKLVPKPGVKKDYSFLKMWVDKGSFHPTKVEFYDKSGNLWKVLEMRKIEKIKDYFVAREMEMKDLKKQHSTKMIIEEIELDTGIPDKIFTKRYLRRTR